MKKQSEITIYSYVSLDGYSSENDYSMEWWMDYFRDCGQDYPFSDLHDETCCVLMSGINYAALQAMDLWPFGNQFCYIVSPHEISHGPDRDIQYIISDNVNEDHLIGEIDGLRREGHGTIKLIGDNSLIAMLLNRNMVDGLTLHIVPRILGSGCKLFHSIEAGSYWKLTGHRVFENGIVQLSYSRDGLEKTSG